MRTAVVILAITLHVGLFLSAGSAQTSEPPWQPAYKIKPDETNRLTAADVVGPDGIVYPDWRYAGIPGGIPPAPVRARLADFGAKADDGRDDADAFEAGIGEVVRNGGGALMLGSGAYHLDRPVVITDDFVVLRGQGREKTTIVFRYRGPSGDLGFFRPAEGEVIGPDSWIEIHAAPRGGLKQFALQVDGREVFQVEARRLANENFVLRTTGQTIVDHVEGRRHRLTAVALWKDGRRREASISVSVDPGLRLEPGQSRYPTHPKASVAALLFVGDRQSGGSWNLVRDGKRGDNHVVLDREPDMKSGDRLVLTAPATPRWNQLVRNACPWGDYRRYELLVEAVEGPRVRLSQPLRIDFPVADGSTARKIFPVRRCGVEDLTLVQTEKLWTTGVLFLNAWECWARGVRVVKAGRYPVYTRFAKWCEIRDCEFDDAWYHGGGGTAYVGWERSYDCLMENVTTRRMRHAPCVQWSASGNVIRDSAFHGSDMQWHAGWTSENLFENCTVDAAGRWGTYGFGGWASPPNDKSHGPEGPRNVVYHCDVKSPKAGLNLGGMNENWLIVYNRFQVESGPGVQARTFSFDHIIGGNVFGLDDATQPAVWLRTADCTGIELIDNQVYGGNGQLAEGPGQVLIDRGNRIFNADPERPRPAPKIPSIFLWQRHQEP